MLLCICSVKAKKWYTRPCLSVTEVLDPLAPKSEEHLISPYYIIPESDTKVMRIEEMIINLSSS